uniref:EF-hand domain-containing protein n=1 Tax=Megaselia scalaris TaxID=36166 RepID=T1GFF2_MEGSC
MNFAYILICRQFAKLNIDKKEDLSFDTFKEAMNCTGFIELQDNEIVELFENFKSANEFFGQLRPIMSRTRTNILGKAFSKLDSVMIGYVDFETFKKV